MFLSNITIVDSTSRSRTAVQTAVIQIFGCLLNEKSLQPLGWKSVMPGSGHGNPPHFKVLFQERVLHELIACVLYTHLGWRVRDHLVLCYLSSVVYHLNTTRVWNDLYSGMKQQLTIHGLPKQGFSCYMSKLGCQKIAPFGHCHHVYTSDHIRSNPFSRGELFWARASQYNPVSIKFYTQVSWSGVTPQNLQLWSSPIFCLLMVYILPTYGSAFFSVSSTTTLHWVLLELVGKKLLT